MPSFPRKKSCEQCRASKTRCSLTLPNCTRCAARGQQCTYKDVSIPGLGAEPIVIRGDTPGAPTDGEQGGRAFHFNDPLRTAEITQSGDGRFQGLETITSNGTANIHTPAQQHQTIPTNGRIGINQPIHDHQTTSTNGRLHIIQPIQEHQTNAPNTIFDDIFMNEDAIDIDRLMPAAFGNPGTGSDSAPNGMTRYDVDIMTRQLGFPKVLVPKPPNSIDAQLTHAVLMGDLLRYPETLTNGMGLPPFFHAPCFRRHSTHECHQEEKHKCFSLPMANCVTLAIMTFTMTPESYQMVAQCGHAEQRRVFHEFESYDQWTLLEAFHALTLYSIMYAVCLNREQKEQCGGSIVITVGLLATKLMKEYGYMCEKEKAGGFPDWEEWIFHESLRRNMIMMFVLGALLEMQIAPSTGIEPCEGIGAIPVPAPRQLWEAKTKSEWEKKYRQHLKEKQYPFILKIWHLRKARTMVPQDSETEPGLVADLERWCRNMDDFGKLLWAATRLEEGL